MKITAYILLVSLVLLGMNRFMHGIEAPIPTEKMTCGMDCCCSDEDCEKDDDSACDQNCSSGCDCGCSYQITAIAYQFISIPAVEVRSYHHGNYFNNYQFEYFIPLFQPPRRA